MNEEQILKDQLVRVNKTLATLIAWMAQSSTGVISIADASKLLDILEGK
jgi:hypothetical protein